MGAIQTQSAMPLLLGFVWLSLGWPSRVLPLFSQRCSAKLGELTKFSGQVSAILAWIRQSNATFGLHCRDGTATFKEFIPNVDDAFLAGKAAYEDNNNNCVLCHGATGLGNPLIYDFNIGPVNNMCGVIDCLNEAELIQYLIDEIPLPAGSEANCGATCASNIAKYMLNNFSVTP